jgi:acetolactate synthase-1/2/3 large subunit
MADIGRVAEAFGIQRAAIQDSANLRGQVRSVLAIQGPVVCMVKVIPDEARAPRVSTVQKPDGSMVSRPLEDLWPFLDRDEFRAQMIVPPIDE